MIIVRLRSGLGNQMFQYAFFKQMQKWHGEENVKLDISTYHWKAHNGLEIGHVFGIDLQKDSVSSNVSLKYADVGYKFHHRVLRRLRGRRHKSYRYWKDIEFDEYRTLNDVYLEGFWNDEKYFAGVQDEVRFLYQFQLPLTEDDDGLLRKIESCESVAVHVRRGDYKKYPEAFPLCRPDYYRQAIGLLSEKYPELSCFVFSDDLEWCKKELSFLPRVTFVENHDSSMASKDLFMMSKCRHNIIANSTFSWWAAWLNNNPDKMVLYPHTVNLVYQSMPDGWTCIFDEKMKSPVK